MSYSLLARHLGPTGAGVLTVDWMDGYKYQTRRRLEGYRLLSLTSSAPLKTQSTILPRSALPRWFRRQRIRNASHNPREMTR
jgi:hypothetical protein